MNFILNIRSKYFYIMKDFKCDECEQSYSSNFTLIRHISSIHILENKIHKCDECKKVFYDNAILAKHFKNKHPDKKRTYKCDECEISFTRNNSLTNHIKNYHILENKIHKCDECNKIFYLEEYRNTHHKLNHPNKRIKYKCNYQDCNKEFLSKYNLNLHIKIHLEDNNPFKCEKCDKLFKTEFKLTNHYKKEHPNHIILEFKCNECNIIYTSKGNLVQHYRRVHTKEKILSCKNCDYKCLAKNELDRHNLCYHTENRKIYTCEKCTRKYCDNYKYKNHIKICDGNTKYSSGEKYIMKILEKYKIEYFYDSIFNNLKSINNWFVRFDFILFKNDIPLFIEYDGQQHFKPVCFGSISAQEAEIQFKNIKANDKIKNNYCINNNYPLMRIKYDFPKEKIEFEILKFIVEHKFTKI